MPALPNTLHDIRPFEVDARDASNRTRLAPTPIRTGIVLIGTPATARQMIAQLSALDRPPVISGAILINSTAPVSLSVPILGSIDELPVLVPRFALKMALVSLPADLPSEGIRGLLRTANIPFRTLPAVEDLLNPAAEPEPAPPAPAISHRIPGATPLIDLGKLIGRTPYDMDRAAVSAVLRNKRVLITGAGGSIGAELARVAAAFEPALLILMERSENALFEIDRQLATHFPRVSRRAVLHDVTDADSTLRLCGELRPHAIFHAAAHKHVPLMEDHPAHAITNNLFGTKSIADAAIAIGAERFVMISSDKAVNPTSVMGATKRLAEIYVRGLGERTSDRPAHHTRLSMVRFGNVLGSSASVLTIWAQQIAEGESLTITDPRMTRYFMTIPEAATLVIQSTTLEPDDRVSGLGSRVSGGTESGLPSFPETRNPKPETRVGVFVLDMSDPIRIVDLALRFARAHGLDLRESDLAFTGIRPGEKLHEELAYAAEQLRPTAHPGIRAWAGPGFDSQTASRTKQMVADMQTVRNSRDPAAVLAAIRRHVPEMRASPAKTTPSDSTQPTHPNAG